MRKNRNKMNRNQMKRVFSGKSEVPKISRRLLQGGLKSRAMRREMSDYAKKLREYEREEICIKPSLRKIRMFDM